MQELAELEEAARSVEKDGASSLLEAHRATEEEQWEQAIDAYDNVVGGEKDGRALYIGASVETRLGRGFAHLMAGHYNAAIRDFVVAQDRWRESLDPVLLLGEAYYLSGDEQETETVFRDFYARTPFRDDAARSIAVLYWFLGEFEKGLGWANLLEQEYLRELTRTVFLAVLKRSPEALRAGEKALEGYPSVENPHGRYGFFLNAVLVGEKRSDAEQILSIVDKLRSSVDGKKDQNLLLYLEGRVLQEEGNYLEAAERFRSAALEDSAAPRPILRLAECLAAAGDSVGSERLLREFLVHDQETSRELWDLWSRICLVDLDMSLADILSVFPRSAARDLVGQETPGSYGEDILWLVEQMDDMGVVRINSGGESYSSAQGIVWGKDRFFLSGQVAPARGSSVDVAAAAGGALYRTGRAFSQKSTARAGYRFPLPVGSYRLTLHSPAVHYEEAGDRVSDVVVEEEVRSWEYGQKVGTGERKCFDVEVRDGFLDIEFVRGLASPIVSAIEISRVER